MKRTSATSTSTLTTSSGNVSNVRDMGPSRTAASIRTTSTAGTSRQVASPSTLSSTSGRSSTYTIRDRNRSKDTTETDERMSIAGTETTVGFSLSIGGTSEKGGRLGGGVTSSDVTVNGLRRSTGIGGETRAIEPAKSEEKLFKNVHLLFVEKVWDRFEAQMLQSFAKNKGCIIHTDVDTALPTWLLVIPSETQEEPINSGQGMRLAFGLASEWRSLRLLTRVKSKWIKDCVQQNRLLDHKSYGLDSIINPGEYDKAHPQKNWVDPKDTEVWYRLVRILEQIDKYFPSSEPSSTTSPSSSSSSSGLPAKPKPSRTGFYQHQDQLDKAAGYTFSSTARGFMAPYLRILDCISPAFKATGKERSKKAKVRQPIKSKSQIGHAASPLGIESGKVPTRVAPVGKSISSVPPSTSSSASVSVPVSKSSHPTPPATGSARSQSPPHPSLPPPRVNLDSNPNDPDVGAANALLNLSGDSQGSQQVSVDDEDPVYDNDSDMRIDPSIDIEPTHDNGLGHDNDNDIYIDSALDVEPARGGTAYPSPSPTPEAEPVSSTSQAPTTSTPPTVLTPMPVPVAIPNTPSTPVSNAAPTPAKRKVDHFDDLDSVRIPRQPLRRSSDRETGVHTSGHEDTQKSSEGTITSSDPHGAHGQPAPDEVDDGRDDRGRDHTPDDIAVGKVETALRSWQGGTYFCPNIYYPRPLPIKQFQSLIRLSLDDRIVASTGLSVPEGMESDSSTLDRQLPDIIVVSAYLATSDTASMTSTYRPSSLPKRRFVSVGPEFLSTYYEQWCNDEDLEHSAVLKLTKDYYGGLDVKEESDCNDLFILAPLRYGNIWTVVLIDVYRQRTIFVPASRQPPDTFLTEVELWVSLLLANMGFAVGKEYCASPADYVRCSLDQEDMSRNRDGPDTVTLIDNMVTVCNLSTLFRQLVRTNPSVWQQEQDPATVLSSLLSTTDPDSHVPQSTISTGSLNTTSTLTRPPNLLSENDSPAKIRHRFRDVLYVIGSHFS